MSSFQKGASLVSGGSQPAVRASEHPELVSSWTSVMPAPNDFYWARKGSDGDPIVVHIYEIAFDNETRKYISFIGCEDDYNEQEAKEKEYEFYPIPLTSPV